MDLDYDTGIEYSICLEDEDYRIIAAGSVEENVLKCIAISPDHQGEGLSGLPGGLHLLPQVVDDHGAVHGVPDGQRHVGHDGDRHHRQPCPLPPQVTQQADRGALGCALHASASLVWDS